MSFAPHNLMPYYTVFMWEKISDLAGAPQIGELSIPSLEVNVSSTLSSSCLNNSNVTYKWTYRTANSTNEITIRDYNSSISTDFTPEKSGKIIITLYAKNSAGAISKQEKTAFVQQQQFNLTGLFAQPESDNAGRYWNTLHNVEMSAQISGNTNNLQYQYSYKVGSGAETIIQSYSSLSTGLYVPVSSSETTLILRVKDVEGNVQTASQTCTFSNWTRGRIIVSDVTPNGYRVTYTVAPPSGTTVSSMKFPTWTSKDGQDDLPSVWQNPDSFVKNSDGTYTGTIYIDRHNHKNEVGTYNTHCYVYFGSSNSSTGVIVRIPSTLQDISITDIDSTGYTVTATAITERSITKAQMPTWTETNGQDDIKWYNMNVTNNGNGTYKLSYRVLRSNHNNESNIAYNSHIYVYDGNNARLNIDGVNSIPNLQVVIPENDTYLKKATVTPLKKGYKVTWIIKSSVPITTKVPTWTENNGQDDLPSPWQKPDSMINNNDGTYTITYTVKTSDHNDEYGMYNTHLYIYNSSGTNLFKNGLRVCVPYSG